MEQTKYIVLYDSNTEYHYTIYSGYNENEAKRQINRLQEMAKVTRIYFKQGAGKYEVVKG